MPPKVSMTTGAQYGRLSIMHEAPNDGARRRVYWVCRCQCGNEVSVNGTDIRNGRVTSCGCWKRVAGGIARTTHGMTEKVPEYGVWLGIRKRCLNPAVHNYARYGGRGITICQAWDDFAVFYRDMGPRPSSEHSIDRIDNDGPYAPWNCRWATPVQQRHNQRRNQRR